MSSNVTKVDVLVRGAFACALLQTTSSSVACWGDNTLGQLAGTPSDHKVPTTIAS